MATAMQWRAKSSAGTGLGGLVKRLPELGFGEAAIVGSATQQKGRTAKSLKVMEDLQLTYR